MLVVVRDAEVEEVVVVDETALGVVELCVELYEAVAEVVVVDVAVDDAGAVVEAAVLVLVVVVVGCVEVVVVIGVKLIITLVLPVTSIVPELGEAS